jgi:hypothetical protein
VLSDWLRVAAADNEAAGRKEAALWNLDRAVALSPVDWTLYALRADLTKARAAPKPGAVWDLAEVELLAAELDAALPRPGK